MIEYTEERPKISYVVGYSLGVCYKDRVPASLIAYGLFYNMLPLIGRASKNLIEQLMDSDILLTDKVINSLVVDIFRRKHPNKDFHAYISLLEQLKEDLHYLKMQHVERAYLTGARKDHSEYTDSSIYLTREAFIDNNSGQVTII